ncbi:MAG: hypothetical protein RIQ52_1626 [Pseudomonadota bacterium]|jgi:hypothetical protein
MYQKKSSLRERLAASALRLVGVAGVSLVVLGSLLLAPFVLVAAWLSRYLLQHRMDEMVITI